MTPFLLPFRFFCLKFRAYVLLFHLITTLSSFMHSFTVHRMQQQKVVKNWFCDLLNWYLSSPSSFISFSSTDIHLGVDIWLGRTVVLHVFCIFDVSVEIKTMNIFSWLLHSMYDRVGMLITATTFCWNDIAFFGVFILDKLNGFWI